MGNAPTAYIILDQNEEEIKFFEEAYQIVKETIEYVLAQEDKQKHFPRHLQA